MKQPNEIKELLKEVKTELKSLLICEDKEFIKALLSANIKTQNHKDKQQKIIDLIKKVEAIK